MKHNRIYPPSKAAYSWPAQPFHVVLVEPEIPPNTGNIARLCAATGSVLHLVGPVGFQLTDRSLKRAGLDYWESVTLARHVNFEAFLKESDARRVFCFSTRGSRSYTAVRYEPGDALVFGSESKGLAQSILDIHGDRVLAIPIRFDHVRSLNLATATGIVLYEALRQVGLSSGPSE